jgi:cellulose synthase/poly-beta-1,6-N-acetylglucosamine synthase-like glycosyltransferase
MNANGLMRQRFRWSFGILQAAWKHRSAFLHANKLGWVALPNILIFQMLLPLVSPLIDIMFLFGAVSYGIDRYFHPESANSTDFKKLVLFFAIFLIIDFMASAVAFLLERKEGRSPLDKWLLSQVWLQRLAYRQLFSLVLAKTIKRAFDGRSFAWDKLERTAALTHAGAPKSN